SSARQFAELTLTEAAATTMRASLLNTGIPLASGNRRRKTVADSARLRARMREDKRACALAAGQAERSSREARSRKELGIAAAALPGAGCSDGTSLRRGGGGRKWGRTTGATEPPSGVLSRHRDGI